MTREDHAPFTHIVESWLDSPDDFLDPDTVLDRVLEEVETKPQRRAQWPVGRIPFMNKTVSIIAAAAAVVAIALIGFQLIGSPDPGGTGAGTTSSPRPSVAEPTPDPTPEPTPQGLLPEGPHVILTGDADAPVDNIPPLTVTIPAPGWYGEVGGGILLKNDKHGPPDGSGMIIFARREYLVYGDACHWESTVPETPATTVDELVAALSSQGSRDASEPIDITLGGYAGKSITLEVPDDVDFTECDPGYGGSWDCGGDGMLPCEYHTGPDEIDTVYILDIDGVVMAWQTGYYTGTSAEDIAELEAIVQSASFGE